MGTAHVSYNDYQKAKNLKTLYTMIPRDSVQKKLTHDSQDEKAHKGRHLGRMISGISSVIPGDKMLPKSRARQEYDKQAHDFEVASQIPEHDFEVEQETSQIPEVEQEASQIPGDTMFAKSKARQAHDKFKVSKEEVERRKPDADDVKMEKQWPGYGGGPAPPERKTRDGTFVNILTGFLILLFMTKVLAWAIKTTYSMLRGGKKTATQNLPEE